MSRWGSSHDQKKNHIILSPILNGYFLEFILYEYSILQNLWSDFSSCSFVLATLQRSTVLLHLHPRIRGDYGGLEAGQSWIYSPLTMQCTVYKRKQECTWSRLFMYVYLMFSGDVPVNATGTDYIFRADWLYVSDICYVGKKQEVRCFWEECVF